jgi:hypothetical protein
MATRYNWMADTDEKAFAVLVELTRNLSPGEKLAQVFEMMEMGRRMDEDRIRKLHPNASGREVFLRTAALRLGSQTVKQAYGWDPRSDLLP